MKYLLFSLCLFISSTQIIKAQIKYTDLSPDITVSSGDSFILNLNPDADFFNDFKLFQFSGTGYNMVGSAPKWVNAILGETQFGYFYPYALNTDDPIGATSNTWNNSIDYNLGVSLLYQTTGATPESYGFWQGLNEDRYLGLRIEYFDKTVRYGWLRLSVAKDAKSLIVKDYAYNSEAGQQILAGQKYSTSTLETKMKPVFHYHIAYQNIHVSCSSIFHLYIYDMSGKLMFASENINQESDIPWNYKGVFLMTLISKEENKIVKFVSE